jgi:hypothetical protein
MEDNNALRRFFYMEGNRYNIEEGIHAGNFGIT